MLCKGEFQEPVTEGLVTPMKCALPPCPHVHTKKSAVSLCLKKHGEKMVSETAHATTENM